MNNNPQTFLVRVLFRTSCALLHRSLLPCKNLSLLCSYALHLFHMHNTSPYRNQSCRKCRQHHSIDDVWHNYRSKCHNVNNNLENAGTEVILTHLCSPQLYLSVFQCIIDLWNSMPIRISDQWSWVSVFEQHHERLGRYAACSKIEVWYSNLHAWHVIKSLVSKLWSW